MFKIGSGDTTALLSTKDSVTHQSLFKKFFGIEQVHYNALASPIDALRTGAILEQRFYEHLDLSYTEQYKAYCTEMDCLVSSLDFAKVIDDELISFIELKTMKLEDFWNLKAQEDKLEYIKKKYKKYYNQVQFQLYCSDLDKAEIAFLYVDSYDDDYNFSRVITKDDYFTVEIERDEKVISEIKHCAKPFQEFKNYYAEDKQ